MQETFTPISEKQMVSHLLENRGKLIHHAQNSYRVSRQEAEDLFGDLSLKVLRHRDKYNPNLGAASTFLFHVMKNLFIDTIRSEKAKFNRSIKPNEILLNADGSVGYVKEPSVDANDYVSTFDFELIMASLDLLPPQFARVMKAVAEDKTYDEMVKEFGLPLGTIKTHIFRGRRILANSLYKNGIVSFEELGIGRLMIDEKIGNDIMVQQHGVAIFKVVATLLGITKDKKPLTPDEIRLIKLAKQEKKLKKIREKITLLKNAA